MRPSLLEQFIEKEGLGPELPPPGSSLQDEWNLMLNLRLKNGNEKALRYSDLLWMDFNHSKGITLNFSIHTVTVEGSNLESIYAALLRHAIPELQTSSTRINVDDDMSGVIDNIHVRQKQHPGDVGDEWTSSLSPKTSDRET